MHETLSVVYAQI